MSFSRTAMISLAFALIFALEPCSTAVRDMAITIPNKKFTPLSDEVVLVSDELLSLETDGAGG